MRITPPKSLIIGDHIALQGKASWMCCNRVCNPGFTDLSLELKVASSAPLDEKLHPIFDAARSAAPHPLAGWKPEAKRMGGV